MELTVGFIEPYLRLNNPKRREGYKEYKGFIDIRREIIELLRKTDARIREIAIEEEAAEAAQEAAAAARRRAAANAQAAPVKALAAKNSGCARKRSVVNKRELGNRTK